MKPTHILSALLVLLLANQAMAGGTDPDTDASKAEYIFLEAQNLKSRDDYASYYDLMRYAHQLDSTNSTISFYVGLSMLSMEDANEATAEQALRLIRKHFEEAPQDYYETVFYSDLNMQLEHYDEALRAISVLNDKKPNQIELQLRLAEAYFRAGRFAESTAVYDSIETIHGKSEQITDKKINNHMAQHDTISALNEMHALLATAPRNVEYNLSMASMQQELGQPDSALFYINRAEESEPNNASVYLMKAMYYTLNGDSAAYDTLVYKALTNENLDVEDKLSMLVIYTRSQMDNDSTQRIDQLFNVLITQHPHQADILNLYSDYLVAKRDFHGAAEQMGYVTDLNPNEADPWRKLMLINMMDNNFPAAIQAADKALQCSPDSLDLYSYIAPAYYQMKSYDKALSTYDKALTMTDSVYNPKMYSDLVSGKADVYFDMGDTLRAFDTYEQALRIYPDNTGAMNNYAYYLSLSGTNLDRAESLAAAAVKAEPETATYLDTYAWVFFRKKDYKMALFYMKSAIDKDDTNSCDLLHHYGDILFFNGETEQAVQQWEAALQQQPDNELLQKKVNNKTYFEQ